MKRYTILIVGIKCYFGHVKEFVSNLKKNNPLVDVTLLTTPLSDELHKEMLEYVNHIVIYKLKGRRFIPQFISKRWNTQVAYHELRRLHQQNPFNIVDIHFATPIVKYVMPMLRKLTNTIVITPWGSDVMRVEDDQSIADLTAIYSQAKFVTVGKDSPVGKCAIEKFGVDPEKFIGLGWGGEFFDYIHDNSINVTTEEAKARFGLNGKYVITCGYNTQQAQRHEIIIDAIYKIKDQLPDNLTLLFAGTYLSFRGRSAQKEKYIQSLKDKVSSLGLNSVFVEEHLEMDDLLKLRMATDIFVHIQTTDAGSRSVMEYVACNKKVVHGSWVNYSYLEKFKPSCYFPVDKLENLGACILKAYQSPVEELPQKVKDIVFEKGWNYKMTLWNSFFESLVP